MREKSLIYFINNCYHLLYYIVREKDDTRERERGEFVKIE